MIKVYTLRNIIALLSFLFCISCKSEIDSINGQWQVQSYSSESAYVPNMDNQNYSLNINQSSGSSVQVSDANGGMDAADIKYRSGDRMIVEYQDPNTGEKVLVQMKKN